MSLSPFADAAQRLATLRTTGVADRQVRVRPAWRMVAFGRREERLPGFDEAVQVAGRLGYAAVVRPVGGSFVPLDEGSLIVDEFGFSPPGESPQDRYRRHTDILVAGFREWGIDARVGELPGEYCPGRFSVNHAGILKLSGTAQRVVGGAWLVSTVVRVQPADRLHRVTRACADALGVVIDPAVTGSVALVADISIHQAAVDLLRHFEVGGAEGF